MWNVKSKLDHAAGHGERVDITLSGAARAPLHLEVPVTFETDQSVEIRIASMPSDRARIDASFDLGPARRVEIDPQFQHRRLSPFEIPPFEGVRCQEACPTVMSAEAPP
jgi:hypothetical protein